MFRRLFRIGFGGCGCALEQEFRDHAVELTRELLNKYYMKDLEKWESVLDNELFKMDYLDDLRGILEVSDKKTQPEFRDTKFEERLNDVSGRLYDWNSLLTKVGKVARPYDVTFIDKVRGAITNMRNEVESTKERGSVLLQSLPVDSFTKTEVEKYERFYTYNQNITETRELIVDQFGHAVIESQGFNHQPELQMLPFSIKEVRDEVFKKIRGHITNKNLSTLTSQGYFFYVGLGGGTGTGVISPLAEKFGKGSYGYFALAVLGAEVDNARMKSQQPWFRRCFNMLIALNDLIVTAELDGLILVDNERLIQAVDRKELNLVFCWEKVHEDPQEERKLIRFLRKDLKLTLAKDATISKETDGNTITIPETKEEDSAEIVIQIKDKTAKVKRAEYLFSWPFDSENEEERKKLKKYLKDKFDIGWVENAGFPKSDADKSISIVNGENVLKITIDVNNKKDKKATLKINDDITHDLTVKEENNKQKIIAEETVEELTVIEEEGERDIYAGELKKGTPLMTKVDEKLIKALYPAFGITTLENGDYDLDWSQLKEHIGLHTLDYKPPIIVPCYASKLCWNSLFCWEKVHEDEGEKQKLIEFLRDDLKLTWVENATISKTKDNNTITIVNGNDSAEMVISDDKTKATVKIDDKSKGLKVRANDGGLNVYKSTITDLIKEALNKGKLARYEDHKKAERVFVYVRCITDEEEVRDALANVFDIKKTEIAIIKEHLFCWEDAEMKDYTELKRFLEDKNLCDISVADDATVQYIGNDKLELDSNKSNKSVELQIGRDLFDWKDFDGLKEYCKEKKIPCADPHFLENEIIICEGEARAKLTIDDKKEKATLSWGKEGKKGEEEHLGAKRPYLFSWPFDSENEKEREKLKKNLKDTFKIDWVDNAVFSKSDDGKTISIDNGKNSAQILIDEKKEKATLILNDDKLHDLKVKKEKNKKEKNKLNIYEDKWKIYAPNEVSITISGKSKKELPLLGVKTWNRKHYLYLKGSKSSIQWVKKNLEKKIVVFESQEIGSFWHEREKENEVLILLVNPNVKDALKERLEEGKKFVNLLVTFKKLLEASTSEYKSGTADQIVNGDIENVTFKRDDEEDVKELKERLKLILKDISDVGIDEKTEEEKNKKKLKEARDFLLPEELYEKDKDIYEYMKGVLERLNNEAKYLNDYLYGKREWPIFREKIFNIISTSGKRDEVILSAISAIDDETKKKFKRLIGDAYTSYLGTFERQFFKYKPSYLYHSMDNILSDKAEDLLPEELKNEINKINKIKEKQREGTGSDEQSSKKEEVAKLVEDNLNKAARLFFILAKDKEGNDRWQTRTWDTDHQKLKELFIQNKVILPDKTVYVPGKYLFSWDDVPGNDSWRLFRYLWNDHSVNLAKSDEFSKSDGDQSISIGENLAKITIDGNKEKATLKINDDRTHDLKVKKENNKLDIYEEDDNERTIINIKEDPKRIYSIKKEGGRINVDGPTDLSFPAMLALAGLYADWQHLLSWNESIEIQVGDQHELIKQLFGNENGKQLPEYDNTFKICASSKVKDFDQTEIRNLLIIDEEKEKATLIARRSSGVLFNWKPDKSPELNKEGLPHELVEAFDWERHVDVKGWGLEEREKDKEWKLHSEDSNTYYYLTMKKKKQFEITGDRVHELKVKVEEVREESKSGEKSKTLKIYKRWRERFEAAE